MVMFRFREPERPQDYRALPRYQRAKFWYAMHRVVTVRSEHTVDIIHYTGQRTRVVGLFLFLFLLACTLAGGISSFGSVQAFVDDVVDQHDYVFNFEEHIRKGYRTNLIKALRERYTEDEWVAQQMTPGGIHDNRFFKKLFGLYLLALLPLSGLLMALFWPKHCPVRFDRKRELAYTWHRGRLYIADIGPMLGGLQGRITSDSPDDNNPLFLDKTTGAYGGSRDFPL